MRRRKRNENTEVTKRTAERTEDNEGVNRGNAYIARKDEGPRSMEKGESTVAASRKEKKERKKKR